LRRRFAIFHRDGFGILHFLLGTAFDAVCLHRDLLFFSMSLRHNGSASQAGKKTGEVHAGFFAFSYV
jgi:hypothetical protein